MRRWNHCNLSSIFYTNIYYLKISPHFGLIEKRLYIFQNQSSKNNLEFTNWVLWCFWLKGKTSNISLKIKMYDINCSRWKVCRTNNSVEYCVLVVGGHFKVIATSKVSDLIPSPFISYLSNGVKHYFSLLYPLHILTWYSAWKHSPLCIMFTFKYIISQLFHIWWSLTSF